MSIKMLQLCSVLVVEIAGNFQAAAFMYAQ